MESDADLGDGLGEGVAERRTKRTFSRNSRKQIRSQRGILLLSQKSLWGVEQRPFPKKQLFRSPPSGSTTGSNFIFLSCQVREVEGCVRFQFGFWFSDFHLRLVRETLTQEVFASVVCSSCPLISCFCYVMLCHITVSKVKAVCFYASFILSYVANVGFIGFSACAL